MDVRCEKCSAEYALDETKISPQGVHVKCTSCQHVFWVRPVAKGAGGPADLNPGDSWLIRQQNGNTFRFKELTTLQRWIVERRVGRQDEISRNAHTWKKLGEIAELEPFFQVLEHATTASGGTDPAWTRPGDAGTLDFEDDDDAARRTALRAGRPWVRVAIALVLLAGGVFVSRDALVRWFSPAPPSDVSALKAAEAQYRQETFAGFALAYEELERAVAQNHRDLSLLSLAAKNQTMWAFYLADEASELEAPIKEASSGGRKADSAEIAKAAEALAKKEVEVATHAERAFSFLERAFEVDANADATLEAACFYYAFKKERETLKGLIERAQGRLGNDADFHFAQGLDLSRDEDTADAAVAALQKAITLDADHLAARFVLARLLSKKDKAAALAALDEVLKRSPEHARAGTLKRKLEGAAPPERAPAASTPASATADDLAAAPGETYAQVLARAGLMRTREKLPQAMDLYERALELKPAGVEAVSGLGFCYLDQEAYQSAILQFQKALSLDAGFADAHLGLAEAYRGKGQKRDAVKHYQKYLALAPEGDEAEAVKRTLAELGQAAGAAAAGAEESQ